MRQHIEEIYDSRETAEEIAQDWRQYLGYNYEIVEQDDGKFKLVLDTNQVMMG